MHATGFQRNISSLSLPAFVPMKHAQPFRHLMLKDYRHTEKLTKDPFKTMHVTRTQHSQHAHQDYNSNSQGSNHIILAVCITFLTTLCCTTTIMYCLWRWHQNKTLQKLSSERGVAARRNEPAPAPASYPTPLPPKPVEIYQHPPLPSEH